MLNKFCFVSPTTSEPIDGDDSLPVRHHVDAESRASPAGDGSRLGTRAERLESRMEKRRWRSLRSMSLTSNGGLKQTSAHQTAAICMQPFDVTRWLSASWWVLSALKGSSERYGLTQPLNSNRNTPTHAERPLLWLFNLNFHPLSYVKDFIRLSFFFFFFFKFALLIQLCWRTGAGFYFGLRKHLIHSACLLSVHHIWKLGMFKMLPRSSTKKSPASIWSPTTLLSFFS